MAQLIRDPRFGPLASATMAEAGWYYVEGDPPGTVRRWTGTEWIGFAVPNPNDPEAARPQSVKLYLDQRGSALSGLTLLALTAVAIFFGILAARLYSGIDALPGSTIGPRTGAVIRIRDLGDYVDTLWILVGGSVASVVLALTSFSFWSRTAAATAQAQRFAPASKRARRFERSAPREMREPRPVKGVYSMLLMVLFSATSGGSTSSHASMNLFARVSDTAMAASMDAKTGVASINPIKMIVWWVLWWLPLLVGSITWFLVWLMGPVAAETMQSVLLMTVVLLVLEVISLLCIIATVGQITSHLTR